MYQHFLFGGLLNFFGKPNYNLPPSVLLVRRDAYHLHTVAGIQLIKVPVGQTLSTGPFFGDYRRAPELKKVQRLSNGVHLCYPYDNSRPVLAIVWPKHPDVMVTHVYPREGGRLKGWILQRHSSISKSVSMGMCTRKRSHKLSHVEKICPGVYLCHTEDAWTFLALVTHELNL